MSKSNFFAALDDSDNEDNVAPPVAKKKPTSAPKKTVVEPSDVEKRPNKNDRNTRNGRNSRPPARDGKRQYDRRSGTGRGREMKKGGGGGHNWGSDQNDAKKAEGPVTEGNEEANTPEETDVDANADAVEEKVQAKEPELVDKTLSYAEYLETKVKPGSDAFKPLETREITENEFNGKCGVKKVDKEFLVMGGGKSLRRKGSGKKEKETLVMDFKVKSAISNDRGGGRRDGGRRDSGRNGRSDRAGKRDKDRRSSGGNLDTNDASAFPSL